MLTTTIDIDVDADTHALRRCMEIAMRDPARKQQLESKLKDESWHAVAKFACYVVQTDNLHLPLWAEFPPCWADEHDPQPQDKSAQRLLRKMLQAGLSRYEPDPMAALALALALALTKHR